MTPETFIEQFETFAEAPSGVAKLRELILQLAVQGKLVPQDENDEPASFLVDAIVSQKAELVREKKVRNSNSHTFRDAGRETHEAPLHGRCHRSCFAAWGQELIREDDPKRIVVDGCKRNDSRTLISGRIGNA